MYLPQIWSDDEFDLSLATNVPGGMSIWEDDKHVFVSAAVPGVDPKDVELLFDKGVLWIKGESNEEEKDKKYYRKSASLFSYRVNVPGEIDNTVDPEATCKNGVMTVKFIKTPQSQPKKITVKQA